MGRAGPRGPPARTRGGRPHGRACARARPRGAAARTRLRGRPAGGGLVRAVCVQRCARLHADQDNWVSLSTRARRSRTSARRAAHRLPHGRLPHGRLPHGRLPPSLLRPESPHARRTTRRIGASPGNGGAPLHLKDDGSEVLGRARSREESADGPRVKAEDLGDVFGPQVARGPRGSMSSGDNHRGVADELGQREGASGGIGQEAELDLDGRELGEVLGGIEPRQMLANEARAVGEEHARPEQIGEVASVVEGIDVDLVVLFLSEDVPGGAVEVALVEDGPEARRLEGGRGTEMTVPSRNERTREGPRLAPRAREHGVQVCVGDSKDQHAGRSPGPDDARGGDAPGAGRGGKDAVALETDGQVIRDRLHNPLVDTSRLQLLPTWSRRAFFSRGASPPNSCPPQGRSEISAVAPKTGPP